MPPNTANPTGNPPGPVPAPATPQPVVAATTPLPAAPAQPVVPTTPPAPVVPQTLPPAPAVPPMPLTAQQLAQADPTVDVGRQFNHLRGELNALTGQWQSWQGSAEQVNRSLSSDLATQQQQLAQAQATIEQQQAQIVQGQEWQVAAQQVEGLQQQNQRLSVVMRYPAILQQQQVAEVPGEEGQPPTQVMVNPYLDLLMNSTLQGPNFEAAVQQLAQGLAGGEPQVLPRGNPPAQLPNLGPGQQSFTVANQGLPNPGQMPRQQFPAIIATPPLQPVMNPQQRIAALEVQREEARDNPPLFRQLVDKIREAKRGLPPSN